MEWLEGKPLLEADISPSQEGKSISDRKKEITSDRLPTSIPKRGFWGKCGLN